MVKAMYVLRVKCEQSWATASVKKSFEARLRTSKTFKNPLKPQKTMFLTFAKVFYAKLWWCVAIQNSKKRLYSKTLHFQFFFWKSSKYAVFNFFLRFWKVFWGFWRFLKITNLRSRVQKLVGVFFGLKNRFIDIKTFTEVMTIVFWRFLGIFEGFWRFQKVFEGYEPTKSSSKWCWSGFLTENRHVIDIVNLYQAPKYFF